MKKTITISKEEYLRLKKLEEIDHILVNQFTNSLQDIKKGNIKRIA